VKRHTLNSPIVSPREFLRERRPERFSDSIQVVKPQLDRSQLEYFLATLTNRSQENEFEAFARGVAERLICLNLLPHTGPTGGGDSKVDSETVPVADTLILGWYSGIGREAGHERWVFAFSVARDFGLLLLVESKIPTDVLTMSCNKRSIKL